MLREQGLRCGSPGADRSISCGRPQVYLRGWRMVSRRRSGRRRKRNSNASVLAVLIDWQLFAGALLESLGSNFGPKRASYGRTLGAKRRF